MISNRNPRPNQEEAANPNVAVLMATYNGEKYIESQVESILNQRGCNIFLYVSDDYSSDKTVELVYRQKCNRPENVFVARPTRRMGSAGGNFFEIIRSFSVGKFDYVAFSDQDDLWKEEHIASAIKIIIDQQCDGVSSSVIALLSNGGSVYYKKHQPQKKYDFLFESPGPGCTFVLCRDLFLEVQEKIRRHSIQADKVFHHDWLIYAIARAAGRKWVIRREPHVIYRQHAANETGARIGCKSLFVRLKKIKSGWYGKQINAISQFLEMCGYDSWFDINKQFGSRSNKNLLRILIFSSECRRARFDQLVFFLALVLGYIPFDQHNRNKS